MIRMIQSQSAGHAKSYYTEALAKSDYYIGGQELSGTFRGRLSNRLGITGVATKERFHALCENRHPDTGKPLTPRTKKDRTVGYDINFHVPKSVSILHALAKDNHVLDAFQSSVATTMEMIQADARTRIRKSGTYADRVTGELLWVDFIHQTARPVDGFVPDPHLHAHCYVFNMTWDQTEQRIKAGQFRHINQNMPGYQTMFHKVLADNLVRLGYQVKPTLKSFEVEGIAPEVIALFSKRTDEIGRVAKEKGITDAKELSELGARTRAKKQKGLTMDELKAEWIYQIDQLELPKDEPALQPGRPEKIEAMKLPDLIRVREPSIRLTADQCVSYAMEHCFERASVVPFNQLYLTAIKHSLGSLIPPQELEARLKEQKELIFVIDQNIEKCTTRQVLAEEQRMVEIANLGRDRFSPLYHSVPELKSTGQQADAIRHILSTSDMVSIVRGAAGAGKTTLMKEAIPLIEQKGIKVTIVAPTSNASRQVLRKEKFENADTVAMLLIDKKRQEDLKNGVLWVDEAGMLGTKDALAILELAQKHKTRVIFGGDTRQHSSVVRGDALRVLNVVGGIQVAEVNKIFRQKEVIYRSAVLDLSKGDVASGFSKLEQIGGVQELKGNALHSSLIEQYLTELDEGKEALIISPTHDQGEKLTDILRQRLRDKGYLGRKEVIIDRLRNVNLTEAQKTDFRQLRPEMVVQFSQNQKGIKRGSFWTISNTSEEAVQIIDKKGTKATLDLKRPQDFAVFTKKPLALSKGDKIQVTKNGFDLNKSRLDNGTILDIKSVSKKGEIIATIGNGKFSYKLDRNFLHLAHAHCVTSHKSQGMTVDAIFVAQPAATFGATDAKQFYVSVSRAREKVMIYTDDKAELLERASQIGDRQAAMELVGSDSEVITDIIRNAEMHKGNIHERDRTQDPAINPSPKTLNLYEDYEPEL